MALDPIKTQVLILHSEQKALDDLSSGIDDRYTVHCAKSGTEALNTLGETPIHVIISAQKLPGMSGVEALREAKKRSPETIGILLAGKDDKDLEALVGEKEVFQIVRGGISGDDLARLIDNATRQMRLLALAESANDTAVTPDETISEHIVMETSENGSTIISDGTGQVPVLDPQRISAAAAAGAQSVDILVLTKDEEFLATVKESSRGMHTVHYATTLAKAEEALAKNRVGVAVVDAAMVGAKVEKLTQHLSRRKQRLVNIVAGRRDDGEMLMDLINRGKVYRFLLKPVSPGRARLAIEASVKHHIEAPDSAFKVAATAAAASKPAQKPASKAQAKPAADGKPDNRSTAAPKPEAKPGKAGRDAARKVKADAETTREVPDLEAISVSADDGLATPFDGDDSSFTETVTGLFSKVGNSLSPKPGEASSGEELESALSIDSTGGGAGTSPFANPKLLGAGAAVAVLIAVAGYYLYSASGEAPETPTVAETPATTTDAAAASEIDSAVTDSAAVRESALQPGAEIRSAGALLDEARLARDAGQIIYPGGGNAVELYAAAVAADRENLAARAEFEQILDDALGMAETAMLERRLAEAEAALDRVRAADPENARLPFLSNQLAQALSRDFVVTARSAIREGRFEDAAEAIAAANALGVADTTDIDAVAEELAAARNAERMEEVLSRANDRLAAGDLLEPANDNARYYYELALSNDPENAAARQGLTVIAGRLVLQARAEIDRGSFDAAETVLDDARSVDAESAEVAAATQALADARAAAAAEQRRQREARLEAERLEAERLAALQRAEEERRAAAAAAVAAKAAEAESRPVAEAAQLSPEDEAAIANADPAAASPEPAADEFIARAATVPTLAQPQREIAEAPVGISELTRTKYVAPKYPRAAERRNQSGWVEVVFTVTTEGTTSDIGIRNSEPGEVFVNAAIKAVERWEFEPVIENGELVEKRVGVRMMFALE